MESWLRKLLDSAGTAVRALAQAVADRFLAFYGWINRALGNIGKAWALLFGAVYRARNWIEWAIGEGYLTIRWLITIRIPLLIRVAKTELTKWASAKVAAAKNELKGLLAILDKWARAAVAAVTGKLADLTRWSRARVDEIVSTLAKVRDIVFNLLTSPSRLASWLAAAMVKEIWNYADRNADKIAIWARNRSVSFTLSQIERIERIIGRIL